MSRRGRVTNHRSLLHQLLPRNLQDPRSHKIVSALLETAPNKKRPLTLKGVHNGRFYRIKLNNNNNSSSNVSHVWQLPKPMMPQGFKSTTKQNWNWSWLKAWIHENWPTLILNFGSVCTLIGFTRSDTLELRLCSITGSAANVIYNFTQTPTRYLPVAWSSLFASVNAVKINEILHERHSHVQMTPEQEDVYIRHFLPHGMTPRQFQVLEESATMEIVPKGSPIIRQGHTMDSVALVVQGSTRASISGRRLTAASAICPKSITEEKAGGNSGAWIGEQGFMEYYWNKEQRKIKSRKSTNTTKAKAEQSTADSTTLADATDDNSDSKASLAKAATQQADDGKKTPSESLPATDTKRSKKEAAPLQSKPSTPKQSTTPNEDMVPPLELPINRYTIVAANDCLIWKWKFDQIETLMNRSTDFRAALSRAMTSAIVSKVINFTVSKTSALPTWSTFLDDWKYNAGATVRVQEVEPEIPGENDDDDGIQDKDGDESDNDFTDGVMS